MSVQTEFRPYETPKRSNLGNIGVIAGGIVTFIGFVLAAYAVSETRKLRDSINSPPYLTKSALARAVWSPQVCPELASVKKVSSELDQS